MSILNLQYTDPKTGTSHPRALQLSGPLLPIEIAVHRTLAHYLTERGESIPAPVVGQALLDTGASISAVHQDVVTQLGIQPAGVVTVGTAGGKHQQTLHPASVSFPGTTLPGLDFATVTACDLSGQGFIALLGRDVLQHFVVVYNGPQAQVTLAI